VNPFNFEQNKELNANYTKDMCATTLDILSRTVFTGVSPDWSDETVNGIIENCRAAGAKV
jgi:hypothetical protein